MKISLAPKKKGVTSALLLRPTEAERGCIWELVASSVHNSTTKLRLQTKAFAVYPVAVLQRLLA